jgi:hypothetical protein
MDWLRSTLLKIFRGAIDQLVQEALEKTVKELNEEIDATFQDERERSTLKSGIAMLRARVSTAIRERL